MSPSESDLRAALQYGDDDAGSPVSANTIIAQGQAIRARRMRILSGAAAAVLVAGGAVGLAQLHGTGGSAGSNAENANAAGGGANDVPHKDAQVPAPNGAASRAADSAVGGTHFGTASQCPATAPHLLLPGGGGTGQFGANDPLFAKPVASLVVCSYGAPAEATSTAPTRLVFSGQTATQIVASMENAHRTPASTPCEPGPAGTSELLAFVGVSPGRSALTPVTATVTDPACDVQVTNGTAVRYGWTPPAVLTAALRGLTPPKVPPRTVPPEPTGSEHGSPIHS